MSLLKRKPDPVTERARALEVELGQLERQIQQLEAQLQDVASKGRFRSTAMPGGPTLTHTHQPLSAEPHRAHEPVLETVDRTVLDINTHTFTTPEHFNEFGVRKYDLIALVTRLKQFFRGPKASNPKLVSYLAAGSIQGPRPLRYEKRVARNRFIVLVIGLLILLIGILSVFVHTR